MFQILLLILAAIFLVGTFFLTALANAFRRLAKTDIKKNLKETETYFYYRYFHILFFPKHELQGLTFSAICALNITRFGFTATSILFLTHTDLYQEAFTASNSLSMLWLALSVLAFILVSFIVGDYLPRILGTKYPELALRTSAPIASLFMFLAFPISFVFLKLSQSLASTVYLNPSYEPATEAKQEIIDILEKTDMSSSFDAHERQIIHSVLTFKERIAREVMVPRVDVFSLPGEISIKEAVERLEDEGFSRIPVYKNTIDNITGVLMYKDLLSKYQEYEIKGNDPKILQAPIETIQKRVLHIPETKKLSHLLQEFRKKQVHLAIIVDEYGGTEGVVTIEDILEEIVGDISDEYDQTEELYVRHSDGGWIADARLSIWDAEEELSIKIPQDGDYDTIGGYIFHITGAIPSKGFVIHHDLFDMEILESNDRCVEKVRIRPVNAKKQTENLSNS